jgi:hypothetical protein
MRDGKESERLSFPIDAKVSFLSEGNRAVLSDLERQRKILETPISRK